jgi:hypothetical protein
LSLAILRFFTKVVLKWKLYYLWSKVYRRLFEDKYKNMSIPDFDDLDSISSVLKKMKWKADDWRTLGDAISYPEAVWARYIMNEPVHDCDEFSIFAAKAIENLLAKQSYVDIGRVVGVLSMPWQVDGKKWKVGGHNVCAFTYKRNNVFYWAHVGNWYGGKVQYTSKRGNWYRDLSDIVKDVVGDNMSLGWAFATTDLKLMRFENGKSINNF